MINIAFAGYARVGKDVAAAALVELGYKKVAFGDIIKRHLDPVVRAQLGFSAFTENDAEKRQIRATLEAWGDAAYEPIIKEFFDTLPTPAVNGRLVRVREAREWVARGGIIAEIQRPGFGPSSDWERDRLEELRATRLIWCTIVTADKEELRDTVRALTLTPERTACH